MHPYRLFVALVYRFLFREEGLTMGEVMWSLAAVGMIVAIAVLLGPQMGADWREFVGRPTAR
jgi:hypothetical protein